VIIEVDRQGRIVLPPRLRERLGLKNGGRVKVRVENSSKVVIEPRPSESTEEKSRELG
jgi:AbrB family looped-hinge helix DNA binding protein